MLQRKPYVLYGFPLSEILMTTGCSWRSRPLSLIPEQPPGPSSVSQGRKVREGSRALGLQTLSGLPECDGHILGSGALSDAASLPAARFRGPLWPRAGGWPWVLHRPLLLPNYPQGPPIKLKLPFKHDVSMNYPLSLQLC